MQEQPLVPCVHPLNPIQPESVARDFSRRKDVVICHHGNAILSQSLNGQIAVLTWEVDKWRHQRRFRPTGQSDKWSLADIRRGVKILHEVKRLTSATFTSEGG